MANFDNLNFANDFVHSNAKRAVEHSKEAEFMGNNFKQVYTEKQEKSLKDKKYMERHMKSQAMFEREQRFYEKRKEELRAAFIEIDTDGSGTVDPEEITQYLILKNQVGQEEAHQMSEEIMANLDENQDGSISLDEFADKYIDIIKKLRYR